MNKALLLLLLATAASCAQKVPEPSDDYVLVEFAARLEEDYQKLGPPPKTKSDHIDHP